MTVGERDPATLVAPQGPPVRCTQDVTPVAVLRTPGGATVLDLGQNLVGRMRIRVSGAAGDRVVMRTAEVMQEGEIYTRPLRSARSTDEYVLGGGQVEEWEPRFTFHGFRYVEVSGWPGDVEAAVAAGDIVARVYHSDLERTGWFTCSDPLVNRLHENVVWSMRGNFLDIPTDCPQRDERVGWTGDIQVFAPTAAFLYDVSGSTSCPTGRSPGTYRSSRPMRSGRRSVPEPPGGTSRRSRRGTSTPAPATRRSSRASTTAPRPGSSSWRSWPARTGCGTTGSS